jgi:hypothetical protein
VDTFYIRLPAALAEANPQISGADIKEKPRLPQPPDSETTSQSATRPSASASAPGGQDAFYKVVLQSPVMGSYDLHVTVRQAFQAGEAGTPAAVTVEPILAAGKLTDQSGTIAVAKSDTLAIGEPTKLENLIPADPGSAADLPYEPYRQRASLAYKYNAPPFALVLPVVIQKEAAVFTTIASAAIVEQVLGRDGTLNGRVTYLLATSKGDRLPIKLPPNAKLYAVTLNGAEAPVEAGAAPDLRIVRLPPSAGQVSKVVLEISYGLDKAAAGAMSVPEVPGDIPVQQTLWRLWLPQDSYLLAHDRNFVTLPSYQADNLLRTLGVGQPAAVVFKLNPQGQAWDFSRQGPPGKLWTWQANKDWFSVSVWIVAILVGAAMLMLSGLARSVIVLGMLLAGAIVHLVAPLLASQVARTAVLPAVLVGGLWLAQWVFIRLPRWVRTLPPRTQPAPAKPSGPGSGASNQAGQAKE